MTDTDVVIGEAKRKAWFAERYAAAMESRFGQVSRRPALETTHFDRWGNQ